MSTSTAPKAAVAVINATPLSVEPARSGLGAAFPEADPWMLLDDRLIRDAQAAGEVTPALNQRMLDLIAYAVAAGADAVLLSCSMYGGAVAEARARHGIPVLGSDEALFEEVATSGFARVLLLGPMRQAVADSVSRLRGVLDASRAACEVVGRPVDGAAAAVAAGDADTLHELLLAAALPYVRTEGSQRTDTDGTGGPVDAVVLANFSISPARARLADALGVPVLSPTELAAARVRAELTAPEVRA
ncbi:aspartate/glutamate racemase family protein [Intrasporangium flavum]|uniref:aspartate/glutamate racemase family protein n=1 Tax=Intrasporangium flavum TaxID=1428657 RepID=UPI00096C964C|nr:aspartate/glutamate racemase family protein [Intrasporangium flavum]